MTLQEFISQRLVEENLDIGSDVILHICDVVETVGGYPAGYTATYEKWKKIYLKMFPLILYRIA